MNKKYALKLDEIMKSVMEDAIKVKKSKENVASFKDLKTKQLFFVMTDEQFNRMINPKNNYKLYEKEMIEGFDNGFQDCKSQINKIIKDLLQERRTLVNKIKDLERRNIK